MVSVGSDILKSVMKKAGITSIIGHLNYGTVLLTDLNFISFVI
jgi:hypothetical protein